MTLTPASGGYRLKQTGGGRSPGSRVFARPCLPGRFRSDAKTTRHRIPPDQWLVQGFARRSQLRGQPRSQSL